MNGKGSTGVKSCKDSDRPSEDDGGKRSPTPSVDKLNRLIGPSPTPRMLTPYEIELLRKCAKETAEVVREVLLEKKDAPQRADSSMEASTQPDSGGKNAQAHI